MFFNSNNKVWFFVKINKLLPSLVFHIVLPPFLTPPMFKAKPNGHSLTPPMFKAKPNGKQVTKDYCYTVFAFP